jgi:hypothetical protein
MLPEAPAKSRSVSLKKAEAETGAMTAASTPYVSHPDPQSRSMPLVRRELAIPTPPCPLTSAMLQTFRFSS